MTVALSVLKGNHQEFLEQTEKIRFDGKKLGDFAQSIILSGPPLNIPVPWNKSEFRRVLSNLSYLRKIHFDSAINAYAYLIKTIDAGKLKDVEELTARVTSSDIIEIHMSNNVVLRNKITKLYIVNEMTDTSPIRGHNKFFKILPSFKQLKDIDIYDQGLHLPNSYVTILNSCTILVSLRFKSSNRSIPPKSKCKKQSRLESLDLDIEDGLTLRHLDYVMDYLPNLKNLKLHSFHSDISLFDQTISQNTQFLNYLQKVPQFEFKETQVCDSSALQDSNFVQIKSFWFYIQKLVADGYSCNLSMYTRGKRFIDITSVSVDRHKKMINIKNTIWLEDGAFDEEWINVLQFLTFRSISITTNSVYFDQVERYHNFGKIINPLINMLKRTSDNYSSRLRIHAIYTDIILKFVSPKFFDYMQQTQPKQSCEEGSNRLKIAAQQVINDCQLSLGGRVLEGKISFGDVEYLVECREGESYQVA